MTAPNRTPPNPAHQSRSEYRLPQTTAWERLPRQPRITPVCKYFALPPIDPPPASSGRPAIVLLQISGTSARRFLLFGRHPRIHCVQQFLSLTDALLCGKAKPCRRLDIVSLDNFPSIKNLAHVKLRAWGGD